MKTAELCGAAQWYMTIMLRVKCRCQRNTIMRTRQHARAWYPPTWPSCTYIIDACARPYVHRYAYSYPVRPPVYVYVYVYVYVFPALSGGFLSCRLKRTKVPLRWRWRNRTIGASAQKSSTRWSRQLSGRLQREVLWLLLPAPFLLFLHHSPLLWITLRLPNDAFFPVASPLPLPKEPLMVEQFLLRSSKIVQGALHWKLNTTR
jgi:hypothetical protein